MNVIFRNLARMAMRCEMGVARRNSRTIPVTLLPGGGGGGGTAAPISRPGPAALLINRISPEFKSFGKTVGLIATAAFGLFALTKNEEKRPPSGVFQRPHHASLGFTVKKDQIEKWESERDQSRPLIIVAGINGVGRDLVADANNQDIDVLAFSRKPHDAPHSRLCIANSPNDVKSVDQWMDLLEPVFKQEKGNLIQFTNMIGDTGDLSECALAMASAVSQLAEKYGKKVRFVQISSIAASYNLNSEYAKKRDEIDHSLLHEYPNVSMTVLRPSLVIEDGLYDHSAPYGPWQLASSPVPLAVRSELKLQPVTTRDLDQAIINARHLPEGESAIINAVGPDSMTQKELVQLFVHKQERNRIVMEFPLGETAKWISENAPMGRFHEYAIQLALKYEEDGEGSILSTKDFEILLGRPLTHVADLDVNKEAPLENPPFREHLEKILAVVSKNPEKGKELMKAILSDIPHILGLK